MTNILCDHCDKNGLAENPVSVFSLISICGKNPASFYKKNKRQKFIKKYVCLIVQFEENL